MDPALLALAVVAGAVATLNPCGFALLPAYLTLLVAPGPDTRDGGRGVAGALRFTAGMATGFVAVFGGFALLVAPLAIPVEPYLPVVTVVMGSLLVALGAWLLTGHSLTLPGPTRRRGTAPGRSFGSFVGYGVTFAVTSLSCTVAPFLAVTVGTLRSDGPAAVVAAYLAYAAGMAAVVGVLAVGTATASSGLITRIRRAGPVVARLGGTLLVASGAYVVWYGWFELRVLAGDVQQDPVIAAATKVQSALSRAVADLGAPALAALALALAVVALVVLRRRSTARPTTPATARRRVGAP